MHWATVSSRIFLNPGSHPPSLFFRCLLRNPNISVEEWPQNLTLASLWPETVLSTQCLMIREEGATVWIWVNRSPMREAACIPEWIAPTTGIFETTRAE